MSSKLLKIGDTVKIKDLGNIQLDNKKIKREAGKIIGKISKIFKRYIYKVEILQANYIFCGEDDLLKIENNKSLKEENKADYRYKENYRNRRGEKRRFNERRGN